MVVKILVISDNHTIDDEMTQLLAHYRDNVDYIVHCGDSEFDKQHSVWSLVDVVVKGNMDFGYDYPTDKVIPMSFGNLYVTHGHFVGVNESRKRLAMIAKDNGAKIAFYGHTHVLNAEYIEGVLCINPGSFNHSRGPVRQRTFAIVTVKDKEVSIAYFNHHNEHLTTLDKTFRIE